MNPKRLFALALTVGLLGLGAASQARQEKNDKEAIKGTWTVTKAEEGGKAQDELAKATFTFKDDRLTLKLPSEKDPVELKYILDPAKNPKTIDIQPSDTKDAAQGIFELKGDMLKLCVADPGGKRPSEFKAPAGMKGVVYIELMRNK
jgi:uncharacterized protein (TIGR03067 family)